MEKSNAKLSSTNHISLLHPSKEPILSAEELIKAFSTSLEKKPLSSNLISVEVDSGAKLNNPTGSWLESKRTEARIRNLFKQVSVSKVAQKGQLSKAVWDGSLKKAKVIKSCGKYWNVMGHLHDNSLYLHSEEALFLLECNNLELMHNCVAMSLQQAFQLLISNEPGNCSLESYLTYSKLVRLGYKVVRHQKDLKRMNMKHKRLAKIDKNKNGRIDKKIATSEQNNESLELIDEEITSDNSNNRIESEDTNTHMYSNILGNSQIIVKKRTNQKECEKKIYPNLRARLDQPGPSWLGDFAENEILKTNVRMNIQQLKIDSGSTPNENVKMCKKMVEQLIEDVLFKVSLARIHTSQNTYLEENDGNNLTLTKSQRFSLQNKEQHITPDVNTDLTRNDLECQNPLEELEQSNQALITSDKMSCSSPEDCVEVLSNDEVSRFDAMSMMPNCYKRNTISLTVPPLDLLPHRAWPKKKVYIIEILRPQLLNVNLSHPNSSDNYAPNPNTSAITIIDDDIEIIDVIPSQSSQNTECTMKKTSKAKDNKTPAFKSGGNVSNDCEMIKYGHAVNHRNPPSRTLQPSNQESTLINRSSSNKDNVAIPFKSSTSISEEVSSSATVENLQCENISELRKRVYSRMIGVEERSSRYYYRDENCFLDPTTYELSESRKCLSEVVVKNNESKTKSFKADSSCALEFRPSKRFPIARPNQCLPCDATWLNDALKHDLQTKCESGPLRAKYSKVENNMRSHPGLITQPYQDISCFKNFSNTAQNKWQEYKMKTNKGINRFLSQEQTDFKNKKSNPTNIEATSNFNTGGIYQDLLLGQRQSQHKHSNNTKKGVLTVDENNMNDPGSPHKIKNDGNQFIVKICETASNNDNHNENDEPFFDKNSCDSSPNVLTISDDESIDQYEDVKKLPLSLIEGPLAELWGGKTKPLLQPIHSKSTAKIMAKLDQQLSQKFVNDNIADAIEIEAKKEQYPLFRIQYDVYLPKVQFRKSSPHPPNYRVTVCKPSDPLPTHKDVESLTGCYTDAVPLLFAVCTISSVSFYCFSQVHLPQMISKG